MRALRWPDAFPAGDLGLAQGRRDVVGPIGSATRPSLAALADFAAMYLWSYSSRHWLTCRWRRRPLRAHVRGLGRPWQRGGRRGRETRADRSCEWFSIGDLHECVIPLQLLFQSLRRTVADLRRRALTGLHLPRHDGSPAPFPEPRSGWRRMIRPFVTPASQLCVYFAGDLSFDLPMSMAGTPFQRLAWKGCYDPLRRTSAMRSRPGGSGVRRLLARSGPPTAATPSHLVPCHRVIGSNGTLTGYGGGLDLKRGLLQFEAQRARRRGSGAFDPR